MGMTAISDALDALRSGRPVVVSGLHEAGIVAWPETVRLAPDLAGAVDDPEFADVTASLAEAHAADAAAGDLARSSGLSLLWAFISGVRGPAPAHAIAARLADDHDLAQIDAADLRHHVWVSETVVERVASATLPIGDDTFVAHGFANRFDGTEHVALVLGTIDVPPLVRVHSECLTGDIFGSGRCDCGEQLHSALDAIVEKEAGVLVYVRNHEGRGIGLVEKLRAYQLQDRGLDTVEANEALGHPPDARHYGAASQMLRALGIDSVRLMTNNPRKVAELRELGIDIAERVPLVVTPTGHNRTYLETKRSKLGHLF